MKNLPIKYLSAFSLISTLIIGSLAAAPAFADRTGRQNPPSDNQITVTAERGEEGTVVVTTDTPEEVNIRSGDESSTLDCTAQKDQSGNLILPFDCELD